MKKNNSFMGIGLFCLFTGYINFCLHADLTGQENMNETIVEIPGLADVKYVQVSPSVVMLQNPKPNGSNITCISTDAGLVFIDCSLFGQIASQFRRDMEEKFKQKTIALLLSHTHTDHFFGMGAFEDVSVVVASAGKERFKQQLSIDFEKNVEAYKRIFPKFDEALKTAKLFMPTRWFEKEIQFGTGDNQIFFRHSGGHSSCSSYVFCVNDKIVVSGDNVQVGGYPYFGDPTGDMYKWIDTLKEYESMNTEYVCPGHGRPVDSIYLHSVTVFFEGLVAVLKKLKKDKVPLEDAVFHSSLPKGYWPEDTEKPVWYDSAVARFYRSL